MADLSWLEPKPIEGKPSSEVVERFRHIVRHQSELVLTTFEDGTQGNVFVVAQRIRIGDGEGFIPLAIVLDDQMLARLEPPSGTEYTEVTEDIGGKE